MTASAVLKRDRICSEGLESDRRVDHAFSGVDTGLNVRFYRARITLAAAAKSGIRPCCL
tara:strand:+ start:386 stop:562 length:177 start_codon:yes stop_codon:yes gene_type:complete